MLVASLSTHPLEMFTLLCFAAGMTLTIFGGIDRSADRKQTLALMLLLAIAAGGYLAVQSRSVPYVAEYERDDKQALRTELRQLASDLARHWRRDVARDLLSRRSRRRPRSS
jgi:hypothetical protein